MKKLFNMLLMILIVLFYSLAATAGEQKTVSKDSKNSYRKKEKVSNVNAEGMNETLGISDPLEGLNRVSFGFNRFCGSYILGPISMVVSSVVPKWGLERFSDFGTNCGTLDRIVACLCEARLGDSGIEAGRFAINLPFLLFYDGANNFFHLPPRNADMGQAFATWGCGPGFYVMLPLLGPSNVRDGIGMGIDHMLDFRTIISWASWGIGYAASVDADAIVDSTPSTFAEAIGNVGGAGMAAEVEGVANTVSYAAEGSSMLDPVSAFSLHAGDLSVMTAAFEDPYYMVKNYWYLYRQIQVADY